MALGDRSEPFLLRAARVAGGALRPCTERFAHWKAGKKVFRQHNELHVGARERLGRTDLAIEPFDRRSHECPGFVNRCCGIHRRTGHLHTQRAIRINGHERPRYAKPGSGFAAYGR